VTLCGAGANTASSENREASHHFTWGADLVLFGMVVWYIAEATAAKCDGRQFMSKWGPVLLTALGSVMVILDPTRHLMLDHGGVVCEPAVISMYNDDGSLSTVGRVCQKTTQVGLVVLLVGMLWYVRLPEKLCHKEGAV